ncbi:hypothetical protein MIMGU_mgv1a018402mg, partial [Erythranthe guttata]
MKANASQQNKFLRIITTPFRALGKARDFYVKRIMDCAGSNVIGLQATSQGPGLPRKLQPRPELGPIRQRRGLSGAGSGHGSWTEQGGG